MIGDPQKSLKLYSLKKATDEKTSRPILLSIRVTQLRDQKKASLL